MKNQWATIWHDIRSLVGHRMLDLGLTMLPSDESLKYVTVMAPVLEAILKSLEKSEKK